jgi:hypothetical protein
MSRYFTLRQAEDALPEVERLLRDALFHRAEFERARDQWDDSQQKIRMSGGMRVNPGDMLALRARRDASAKAVKDAMEGIDAAGAQVKDLDIGLVDFMTLYHGQEVCLCWKLGEEAIRYWHGAEEGFQGRKPIDEEFLKHHTAGRDVGDDPKTH